MSDITWNKLLLKKDELKKLMDKQKDRAFDDLLFMEQAWLLIEQHIHNAKTDSQRQLVYALIESQIRWINALAPKR